MKKMSLKPIIYLAAALLPAMLHAETVRWEILRGMEMTPEEGNPQWYTATIPVLPSGTSIDFTDGDMARTTAAHTADNTTVFTVDSDGKVVPYDTFTPTTIHTPDTSAGAEAVYYTLQGVRVDRPGKGLYIRVLNGKASKILL